MKQKKREILFVALQLKWMSGPLKFSRINLKNYPFSVICLIQARDVIAVHKITGVVLYLNRKKFNPPYDHLFVNIFGVCKKTRVFWSKNTALSSFSGSKFSNLFKVMLTTRAPSPLTVPTKTEALPKIWIYAAAWQRPLEHQEVRVQNLNKGHWAEANLNLKTI